MRSALVERQAGDFLQVEVGHERLPVTGANALKIKLSALSQARIAAALGKNLKCRYKSLKVLRHCPRGANRGKKSLLLPAILA